MSATARKLLASFEKLDPKERRAVAVEILRLVGNDGLEEELAASAAALFRGLDEEEMDNPLSSSRLVAPDSWPLPTCPTILRNRSPVFV